MKIRTRLLVSFLSATALTALMGTFGIINTSASIQRADQAYTTGMVPLQAAASIMETFLTMQINLRNYRDFVGTKEELEASGTIRQQRTQMDTLLTAYGASLRTDAERQELEELRTLYGDTYLPLLDRAITLISSRSLDGARDIFLTDIQPVSARIVAKISRIILNRKGTVEDLSKNNAAAGSALILLMIAISVLSVVASLVMGIAIAASISRPLHGTVRLAQDIRRGDLTMTRDQKEMDRSDELGELTQAMVAMTNGLRENIREVRSTGESLDGRTREAAGQMHASAGLVTGVIQRITDLTEGVVAQDGSIRKGALSAIRIRENLDTLGAMIEDQASHVTESSASIEQMISNIGAVMHSINLMGAAFRTLEELSKDGQLKLGTVTETVAQVNEQSTRLHEANGIIKAIAAKTNLLAMNAAIEAAHAGSSGMGFAVVADEIRNLAELSARQSREISSDIKSIQDRIGSMSGASGLAEKSFSNIMEQIRILGRFEAEIRNAMGEQTEGSRQVLEATGLINDITTRVRTASLDMGTDGQEVGSLLEGLQDTSDTIRRSMEQILSEVHRMEEHLAALGSVVAENSLTSSKLMEEVAHFTI